MLKNLNLFRFTQKNILRVYPKGTRVNSSNYDPVNAWIHGAQMVAFNMQVRFQLLSVELLIPTSFTVLFLLSVSLCDRAVRHNLLCFHFSGA